MKPILVFLLLVAVPALAQIPYGNNPEAGRYYSVNGVRLYVEEYGTGKPLLLIHGNGGSIEAFSKTIPYFAKKRRVIAVDSRAHGKSIDPGDSLSFELMADDFAALLTTLKIDSADVIGWSDGGINALLLAMRHPKKVRRLVSTGANLTPDSTALLPSLWKQQQKGYAEKKTTFGQRPKRKTTGRYLCSTCFSPTFHLLPCKLSAARH